MSNDLIDLSNEEKLVTKSNSDNVISSNPSNQLTSMMSTMSMGIGETFNDSPGNCNNPFDRAQLIANRADDPFENVFLETNNIHHSRGQKCDIKTDNLLSISGDDVARNLDQTIPNETSCEESAKKFRRSFAEIATSCTTLINLESPPVMFSLKSSSEIADSATSGDSDGSITKVVHRKKSEKHNRLLKLSLSNSISNDTASKVSRRLIELACDSALSEKTGTDERKFQSFDDSCDDLASILPNWVDSESDIDKDLEMLTIPMLKEIDSPSNVKRMKSGENFDLESLQKRVEMHRNEANKNEISVHIENLKLVIEKNANDEKKIEAINYLENLSTFLNEKDDKSLPSKDNTKESLLVPQSIVRQGTFDIDLKNEEVSDGENKEKVNVSETSCIAYSTHSISSEQSVQAAEAVQADNIEIMKTGSVSVVKSNSPNENDVYETSKHQTKAPDNVYHIVDQIGKMFGSQIQNLNVLHTDINGNLNNNASGNPTVIVVMNTPVSSLAQQSDCERNESYASSDFDKSRQLRRRSNSFSGSQSKLKKPATVQVPILSSSDQTGIKIASQSNLRRNSFGNAALYNSFSPFCATNAATKLSESFAETSNKNLRYSIGLNPQNGKNLPMPIRTSTFKRSLNAKKLKFKASTESIFSSNGPMKATIPMKTVAPHITTTNASPPVTARGGQNPATSTPIFSNSSNLSMYSYRKLYTTPTMDPSPVKRANNSQLLMNKTRYSLASTTMPASLGVVTNTKRRSVNEIRPKSSRISIGSSSSNIANRNSSSSSSIANAAMSGISKQTIRNNVKIPQNFSRTLNKLTSVETAKLNTRTARITQKLSGTSSTALQKNKENKRP